MNDASPPAYLRPDLVFRVGITGARHIKPEDMERIRSQVADILTRICDQMKLLSEDTRARSFYKESTPAFSLTMVSPLAEGADRIAAEEALKLGYSLVSPLPFAADEYETDFPKSVESFRQLLDKSTFIELDGSHETDAPASYEAVGRFVVRNCDLIISIWDGVASGKRGGTAEISRYAAESGVPILWINALKSIHPVWIANASQWARRNTLADTTNPIGVFLSLKTYQTDLILPSKALAPYHHSLIGRLAYHLREITKGNHSPLTDFLNETIAEPDNPLWQFYSFFLRFLAPGMPSRGWSPREDASELESYWLTLHNHVDALSVMYGNRYRSSYLMIIFLAFVSVVVSAFAAARENGVGTATFVDLVLLFGIGGLVFLNHFTVWHDRWVDYRILAELSREQCLLCNLGMVLPRPDITRFAAAGANSLPEGLPRETWVAWYFEAMIRSAPLPAENSAFAKHRSFEEAIRLIDHQMDYHSVRSERDKLADLRLNDWGYIFFAATILVVILRLVLVGFDAPRVYLVWTENVAAWFSAASAALVGIRFYSEFGLLHRQSDRMQRFLIEILGAFDAIDCTGPLSSAELGRNLYLLAVSMLQETQGWADLFGIKSVEPS